MQSDNHHCGITQEFRVHAHATEAMDLCILYIYINRSMTEALVLSREITRRTPAVKSLRRNGNEIDRLACTSVSTRLQTTAVIFHLSYEIEREERNEYVSILCF